MQQPPKKLYTVTQTITLRRTMAGPSSDTDLRAQVQSTQQIGDWGIVERSSLQIEEVPVPPIGAWEAHTDVEYYSDDTGQKTLHILVPDRLIRCLGLITAFELTTGCGGERIFRWDEVARTSTGGQWEQGEQAISLKEFIAQAFNRPLALDTFTDPYSRYVLIAGEPFTLTSTQGQKKMTFSLYTPTQEKAVSSWTMPECEWEMYLPHVADAFPPQRDANQIMGKATP